MTTSVWNSQTLLHHEVPLAMCIRSFSKCTNASTFSLRWFQIHSFIPAISIAPLQVLYYSEALPTTARILYRSFTPKRTGNCMKRLAKGPYVAARAGVEPTTLQLKVIVSTKAPPRPTRWTSYKNAGKSKSFRHSDHYCRSKKVHLIEIFRSTLQHKDMVSCWYQQTCKHLMLFLIARREQHIFFLQTHFQHHIDAETS